MKMTEDHKEDNKNSLKEIQNIGKLVEALKKKNHKSPEEIQQNKIK